jgi:simple sugar transport system ATP-binding protein
MVTATAARVEHGRAPPHIEASGMSKRFGTLVALDDVSLTLAPGSFHALLGENGAGKSTLVKCMMGYYQPDGGRVAVDGLERPIASPRDAHALGIGMVYQQFTLVPNMTVAENLLIARADLPATIDWRSEQGRLRDFLRDVPFKIDLAAPITSLAAGEKQKVEILKQLYLDCRVIILDEPTSVLTPDEADQILRLLRTMTRAGALTVLLITHKLREVAAFADEVTVLRLGRVVGHGKVSDLDAARLADMMVGAHGVPPPATRSTGAPGQARLRVESLCAENDRGHRTVSGVSFAVRGGEIVGIAGVSGNGQRELVEVLAGQRSASAGSLFVNDRAYTATRAEMRRHSVFCLPEEPLRNACVGRMSVAENLAFRTYDRPPQATAGVLVSYGRLRERARSLIERYRIKAPTPDAAVETLSGGNVQRMVLARELSEEVQLLIVANPCFGLDIRAIAEIRGQIMKARNGGAAILLVSEDLDELFELADRILVFFSGKIVAESPIGTADRRAIGRHMAGH